MMKPAEFSRRMGVTESIVSRWISEEREMSYENAVLAARILDCHAEDFYEWIDVKKGNRQ
ncbi:helix-turn-helix domain-containing protein [Brevibacillus sp. MER 51]|nr:helix-turn-helix domain-containing protein [Brevibacillus sp. MER 51]